MHDLDKLTAELKALLKDRVDPFRYDLSLFSKVLRNTPRRILFAMVSDALTIMDVVDVVGEWCIAEIEGNGVQFNPVVELEV